VLEGSENSSSCLAVNCVAQLVFLSGDCYLAYAIVLTGYVYR